MERAIAFRRARELLASFNLHGWNFDRVEKIDRYSWEICFKQSFSGRVGHVRFRTCRLFDALSARDLCDAIAHKLELASSDLRSQRTRQLAAMVDCA